MTSQFNQMQTLKRRFFAMRNGLLADQMRRAGSHFRIIFGLNIIQLNEIAADYGHDPELAATLWANTTTRESMLLAPMLWRPDDFSREEAVELCTAVPDPEVADMVCHKLLKTRPDAPAIAETLIASAEPLMRYTALRLTLPLVGAKIPPEKALAMAQAELAAKNPLTLTLAAMIKSEAEFFLEDN